MMKLRVGQLIVVQDLSTKKFYLSVVEEIVGNSFKMDGGFYNCQTLQNIHRPGLKKLRATNYMVYHKKWDSCVQNFFDDWVDFMGRAIVSGATPFVSRRTGLSYHMDFEYARNGSFSDIIIDEKKKIKFKSEFDREQYGKWKVIPNNPCFLPTLAQFSNLEQNINRISRVRSQNGPCYYISASAAFFLHGHFYKDICYRKIKS